MPIGPTSGFLDFTNATPRADVIIALSNVGVGTDVPLHALDIRGTANVADIIINNDLTLTGGLTTNTLTINNVSMSTTSNFQQVTNVANATTNTVRFTNPTTGFTVSSNAEVGGELSVSGNVGIGTTEPTESLDIVGNLNLQKVSNTATIKLNSNVVTEYTRSKKLIKYPRVALTSASGGSSGYQGYYVTESSNSANTNRHSWKAFDTTIDLSTADNAWANDQTTNTYNGTDNAYTGSLNLGTGAVNGEWIKLQLPIKIKLQFIRIWLRSNDSTRIPEDWKLYGSSDDSNWTNLLSVTGQASINENLYEVNTPSMYDYFAVVVTKISGQNNYFRIVELEYYGVPEYDPEAHGTDVIARSVPNVPNTDWLEVYYDGQDYTSMPSSVTDKSGNGVNGTPTGVTFDSTWKAFVFDEADDYITFSPGKSGNYVFSASIWFKSTGSSIETLFTLNGDNTTNQGAWLYGSGNDLIFDFSNNSYNCDIGRFIGDGQWHHVCCTYNGDGSISGRDIYLDGMRLYGVLTGTSAGGTLNLTSSTSAQIGAYNHPSLGYIHEFKGSIANFRLFNRALTKDEIWQLYAYQKEYFDVSPDVVTFKGGRLGVGTSDPRAVLDVEGDTFSRKYNGGRSTFLTWDYLGSRSTSFAQPTNTSGGTVASILDYEFNIPSCYHDLGTTTLKAYVKVDWRGEFNVPWNFLFRLKVYYNDYSSTYTLDSSMPDQSADNRGRGCGVPTVSFHSNYDSTLEAASVTSQFTLKQCQVSKGSKIKVELIGVYTDVGGGAATLWTGRCASSSSTAPSFEMVTSSFFVALDVV